MAYIYRIAHVKNLDEVFAHTCCMCRSIAQAGQRYEEIGNQDLISRRHSRLVPCSPYGTLSDYVPFYFTPYSPMLYNIKTGWGVVRQSMADIAIIVSSIPKLEQLGVPFVFTDRHAYLKTAQFSNNSRDLDRIVWDTLQRRDFKKDETDKVEKYQAEALVYKRVPLDAILGVACYNEAVASGVQALARRFSLDVKVAARPSWYL